MELFDLYSWVDKSQNPNKFITALKLEYCEDSSLEKFVNGKNSLPENLAIDYL